MAHGLLQAPSKPKRKKKPIILQNLIFYIVNTQCHCAQKQLHKEMVFPLRCGRTWLSCTEPRPQPNPASLRWSGTLTVSQTQVGWDPTSLLDIRINRSKSLFPSCKTWWKALNQKSVCCYIHAMTYSVTKHCCNLLVSTYFWPCCVFSVAPTLISSLWGKINACGC